MKPIPASYTVKHRIGLYLHRHPDSTVEQLMAAIKGPRGNYVRQQTEELARDEFIYMGTNGGFHLSARYKAHFENIIEHPPEHVDLVPPRQPPEMTSEISPKFRFWDVPRREPIRTDVSFKNGSTDFKNFIGYLA